MHQVTSYDFLPLYEDIDPEWAPLVGTVYLLKVTHKLAKTCLALEKVNYRRFESVTNYLWYDKLITKHEGFDAVVKRNPELKVYSAKEKGDTRENHECLVRLDRVWPMEDDDDDEA